MWRGRKGVGWVFGLTGCVRVGKGGSRKFFFVFFAFLFKR